MQADPIGFDMAMFKFHEKQRLQTKRGGIVSEKKTVISLLICA